MVQPLLPILLIFSRGLVELHQLCYALALGHVPHGEAVSLHHGLVVLLVGLSQLRGHGGFIIEVGKAGVSVEGASIQDVRAIFNILILFSYMEYTIYIGNVM